jgi:hypothetical protein
MNCRDEVPVLILHILEADISQNAGIVDQDINAAEVLNSSFNDLLTISDAVVVGYGLAARSLDLIDDDICSLCMEVNKTVLSEIASLGYGWAIGRRIIPLCLYPLP